MESESASLLPPLLVVLHAAVAFLAVILGAVQLLRTRGDPTHRVVGRIWVIAMAVTCLTSFGLVERGFTWLHGLSIITLASLALGVVGARRGNLQMHVGPMVGSYVGTVIAFAFAVLVPERMVPTLLREQPMAVAGLASLVGVVAALVLVVVPRVTRAGDERRRAAAPAGRAR